MTIKLLQALQRLCTKLESCVPHLYTLIGKENAEDLAEACEAVIHALDEEALSERDKPEEL
jgi:hypothetical protein